MSEVKGIYAAIIKAQAEIGGAKKDAKNPHFKSAYATLESVIEAIKPVAAKHGLGYLQRFHDSENGVAIETIIIHDSGQDVSTGVVRIPAQKNDAQGYGSAITYARRYSLQTAFGIAPEDDDGNAATASKPTVEPPRAKKSLATYQAEADTHTTGINALALWYKANEANFKKDLAEADHKKLLAHLTKRKAALQAAADEVATVSCPDGGAVPAVFCADECGKREGCPAHG